MLMTRKVLAWEDGGNVVEGSRLREQKFPVSNTEVSLVYSKDWEKARMFGAW